MKTANEPYLPASVLDSSGDAFFIVDLEMIIIHWNKAAEKLYGNTATAMTGRQLSTVSLPDEIKRWVEYITPSIRHMIAPRYEQSMLHKNGETIELDLILSPVRDVTGQPIGLSVIARERMRLEGAEILQDKPWLRAASDTVEASVKKGRDVPYPVRFGGRRLLFDGTGI